MTILVDGNNVVGTTPDGWWRDRPGAVRRLLERLQASGELEGLTLVLDVPQADLPEGDHGGVTVRYATRRGRDAADDLIVELAEAGDEVVTSDRGLAGRVAAKCGPSVTLTGARAFLARMGGSPRQR